MHFQPSGNGALSAWQLLSVESLPPYSPGHHLFWLPMNGECSPFVPVSLKLYYILHFP
ncbi:hypothetical protein HMPREF9374_2808 [Desmospora sp. 8437]|nr:hypothetical protein HMPREF9374_2808 [Desmospora sp. 8437]